METDGDRWREKLGGRWSIGVARSTLYTLLGLLCKTIGALINVQISYLYGLRIKSFPRDRCLSRWLPGPLVRWFAGPLPGPLADSWRLELER